MSAPVYDASEWKPGDVGLLRLAGTDTPAVGICFRGPGELAHYGRWRLGDGEEVWSSVRSARRLVVIDPEDAEQVERLLRLWVNTDPGQAEWGRLLNNLTAALREFANPTPRIEEPQGLGAVVEDAEGADWHRTREGRWIAEDGLRTRAGGWGHINQPARLVTEGVTP